MRSRGLKAILAGRILEILYQRTTGFGICNRRPIPARAIADELNAMVKNRMFAPRLMGYLRQSDGVSVDQVTGILVGLRSTKASPRQCGCCPLVAYHDDGTWSLAAPPKGIHHLGGH